MSAQIQKGETFTDVSPGKSVTSTRLNNHVDGAILLPGCVTEQTDVSTALASDDTLLIHDQSASGLKRVQAQNLLVPEAITAKTDISTAIAAGDLFLMADVSASNALLKVQAQNILPVEAITAKTDISTGAAQDDLLLISDTSASGALKKITLVNLHASSARFTSSTVALNGLAAGKNLDAAHSLTAAPRWVRGVLVCTTAELGYSIGDEVDFDMAVSVSGSFEYRALSAAASATNVFATQSVASSALYIIHKTTGVHTNLTQTSWSMKIYAGI